MSEMRVMGPEGDTKIIWDADEKDEVKNARRTFDNLRSKGYTAYSVKKNGDKKKVVTEFDPDAEKLIMVPAMVGG
jgi:hypothetical protein